MAVSSSKISVIVPVYNVEKYLNICIESIVTQTYSNLEIILIDDGSTDRSPAICDVWAERDSRVKVIHQENGGVSAARNKGLQFATGEYIGFVDSDDWIKDTMYQTMVENIESKGTEAAFIEYMRVLESGEIIPHIMHNRKDICTREEAVISAVGGGVHLV